MNLPFNVRGFGSLFKISKFRTGSKCFSLSTSGTSTLILICFLLILTKYLWSDVIKCMNSQTKGDFLDTYCWTRSTYSVIGAFQKKVGKEVIYPGIENSLGNEKNMHYHIYYQWTPIILLIQAILFYTPRWLWKSWEGGKIRALMLDLDIGICAENEKRMKKQLMIDYLLENFTYHNWWAYKYYFCEVLALINVIGQMFLMNRFFDGAFLSFGIRVLEFMDSDQEDRIDPIIQVFPKMTKCTFYKYGVSGEVERHDAICILPLNVVNEKIYVFLWFWFILLAMLTLLTIVYRIIIILSPRMRMYLLRMRYRLMKKEDIDLIVRQSKMGDWFLFYMLGENVDSVIFRDVIHELARKLRGHHLDFPRGFKNDMQEP
ncbi:PREDICTED: innexin shaking-B isoform X2 [Nicrophorus vespilloides]|uniref:Innexin n=1 Tax=Nicrophorus vespilloides TaxID=110193 RepID=A0ABM1NCK1_NICVS|nr:PREDICTED: innexin shaking-B isoform X2 [Nicrophorus vespilloides]